MQQSLTTVNQHHFGLEQQLQQQHQYLAFTLNAESYAVGILYVKEIIEYRNLTPVPIAPVFIRGVLNLRGNVLPVIDLSLRLELPSASLSKHTCIVIIEMGNTEEILDIGIVVDAVNDVLSFPLNALEPAPAFGSRIRSDFIRHIGKQAERFITILDIEKVLSIEELSKLISS